MEKDVIIMWSARLVCATLTILGLMLDGPIWERVAVFSVIILVVLLCFAKCESTLGDF